MTSTPEVVTHESAERLARDTADRAVLTLRAALDEREVAHLVVTGGGILGQVMTALADPARAGAVDWHRVHVWWGDERYVAADSEDRNDLVALADLFDRVPVDRALLHRMPAADAGFPDVDAAARWYAAELDAAAPAAEDVPRFDVVLLGVGPDGHCASLFPGHPATGELDETVVGVRESPKPPPVRMSLTFPALDAANEVWFIASGAGKADAVAKAWSGASRVEVPSAGPRGRERTLWLIDRQAAAKLTGRG